MDSCNDTPKGWVAPFGYPRIKACSRLPVAFRSVPRPSSPPGAKASTECPSLAQDRQTYPSQGRPSTMHRNHPQSQPSDRGRQLSATTATGHQRRKPRTIPHKDHLAQHHQIHPPITSGQWPTGGLHTTDASEHLASVAGGPVPKDRPHPVRHATKARPETHQNLIYPDKDHPPACAGGRPHGGGAVNGIAQCQPRIPVPSNERPATASATPNRLLLRDTASASHRSHQSPRHRAARSNPGHGGGDRTRTDDPLLAKQVLSQLSYTPETGCTPNKAQPTWWAREDLNLRPHAYQACALTS